MLAAVCRLPGQHLLCPLQRLGQAAALELDQVGETVAVFGAGGLGMSAIQLAAALGAKSVFAVDIDAARLALAERLGAIPIDAGAGDPVAAIRDLLEELGRG